MTENEMEAYKALLVNEILDTKDVSLLNAIKGVLTRNRMKYEARSRAITDSSELTNGHTPCCYTIEEIRNTILSEIESYRRGNFIADNLTQTITIRWSESGFTSKREIEEAAGIHQEKFVLRINKAIDTLAYNKKAGRKDKAYVDLLNGSVRSISISRYCKMFYIIEPECLFILAIQNSIQPLK